jgi:hypothetical protein
MVRFLHLLYAHLLDCFCERFCEFVSEVEWRRIVADGFFCLDCLEWEIFLVHFLLRFPNRNHAIDVDPA